MTRTSQFIRTFAQNSNQVKNASLHTLISPTIASTACCMDHQTQPPTPAEANGQRNGDHRTSTNRYNAFLLSNAQTLNNAQAGACMTVADEQRAATRAFQSTQTITQRHTCLHHRQKERFQTKRIQCVESKTTTTKQRENFELKFLTHRQTHEPGRCHNQ